jgi:hypothetical protein
LEDAPRMINGASRVVVEANEKFGQMPVTLIPSYPDLPMEKVYPRQAKTDIAGVYLKEIGTGRVVYFPWDIDRTYWEVLAEDHFKVLRNSVNWATNETPMIEVSGPGLVEVTAWRNRDAIVVHLVNLSNPMAMKGPYREFIPIGEQKISVRLPEGMRAKKTQLLVAGTSPHAEAEEELKITVSSVLDHEVVAIDL